MIDGTYRYKLLESYLLYMFCASSYVSIEITQINDPFEHLMNSCCV